MSEIPDEFKTRLEELAFRESKPYCYDCAVVAPSGRCPRCGSDDLMRYVEGVGVEWGTEWVIEHLLKENLEPVDTEEAFADSVREIYGESVQVAWIEVDTVDTIKAMDLVSYELGETEWIDAQVSDGLIVSADGGTWYWTHDLEAFLDGEGV